MFSFVFPSISSENIFRNASFWRKCILFFVKALFSVKKNHFYY